MKRSHGRSPHAPIEHLDEDLLGRGDFVRRLVSALITDDNRRARGRVLALDGPWGAGKSSLLHLVANELERRCGSRLVLFRFNPWLVASGDDLLRAFFKEFSEALPNDWRGLCGWIAAAGDVTARKAFRKAAGELLVLAGDSATGGWGAAAMLAGKSLQRLGETTPTLSQTRIKLHKALAKLDRPIVVLIDEIDRAEASEIRAMMMLIRAVVDAPNVSYLLAYDGTRLRKVLGNTDSALGGKYLEKIVQIELPVPLPETKVLLRILDKQVWPEGVPSASRARWEKLCWALFPYVITNFRGLWRVQETFAVLRDMTLGEIDEVDLVGAAALKALYPHVWDRLRADWMELPRTGIDEPFDYMRQMERHLKENIFTWKKWGIEESLPEARILSNLFPAIEFSSNDEFHFRVDDAGPSEVRLLRQGRQLQILMRLDRMQGVPTLADAKRWLQEERDAVSARLLGCTDDLELSILEEALRRAIAEERHVGFPNVWCGVSDALIQAYRTAEMESLLNTQNKLVSRQQHWRQCWFPFLKDEQASTLLSPGDTIMILIKRGEVVISTDLVNILARTWKLPGFSPLHERLPGIDAATTKDALKACLAENARLITNGGWLSCQFEGSGYHLLRAAYPNDLPRELKTSLNGALHDDRQAAFAACLTRRGINPGFSQHAVGYLFDEAVFIAAMERLCDGGHGQLSDWLSAARSHSWFGNEEVT